MLNRAGAALASGREHAEPHTHVDVDWYGHGRILLNR